MSMIRDIDLETLQVLYDIRSRVRHKPGTIPHARQEGELNILRNLMEFCDMTSYESTIGDMLSEENYACLYCGHRVKVHQDLNGDNKRVCQDIRPTTNLFGRPMLTSCGCVL